MSVKIEKITEPLKLGEGPHWDERQQALFIIDVFDSKIYKYEFATKKVSKTKLDGRPGFIVPVEGKTDQFVMGLDLKFVIIQWDGEDGSPVTVVRTLADVDRDVFPKTTINDGKADPRGRIFAGTMDSEKSMKKLTLNKSSLYRLDKTEVKKMFGNITVSNGLAWDLSKKAFYYIDTIELKIRRYDYDVETGEISNMKYIFDLKANGIDGGADGATIDSEGNLWVACFGEGVIKIDPVKGELLQKINFPTKQVTSVTFGGPDFDILFVTTASVPILGPQEPPSGCTFMVTGLGVKGLPNVSYKQE